MLVPNIVGASDPHKRASHGRIVFGVGLSNRGKRRIGSYPRPFKRGRNLPQGV